MKLGPILQVGKEQETQRQRLGHDNRINNEEMKDIESKEKDNNN